MFDSLLTPAPYNPPPQQRYVVNHPRLGAWRQGSVLQADLDLAGANLAALVASRAISETDQPRNPVKREDEPQ
jgi:hypothetical protein